MAEITVTEQNFEEEVMNAKEPVLLDFWASWCGPCKMLSPVIKEIADEYDGKVKVGKINVDEQPSLAAQFGVSGIPTLVLMKDGKPARASVGYIPKDQVEELLK